MSSPDRRFLLAAEAIGRRIAADAVWHDGMCSWVGAVADPTPPWRAEHRALDPVLYDGTAGVGLFLAELARLTDAEDLRRTAAGALRHALARARALPPARRQGFHAGSLGIAWAAARASTLMNDEELRLGARALAAAPEPPAGPERRHDVVLGGAGTILALLALADALDDRALVDDAVAAGGALLGAAAVTRHGWSWPDPGRRHRNHLCGLAHGAAGIGWALLELFAATGDERFRTGATGAFAYERSWLRAGTWPDLRIGGQRRGSRRRIPSPAVGTWCHGEGGIALTRLRAIDVLGSQACREDLDAALEATRRHLAGALPFEIEDLTLCHGAAGAAEVMLCADEALGEPRRERCEPAAELGSAALERHGADGDRWPCDAAGGEPPGLFRGLSGIGWWFLRLHDRAVPSPLALPAVDSGARMGVVSAGG